MQLCVRESWADLNHLAPATYYQVTQSCYLVKKVEIIMPNLHCGFEIKYNHMGQTPGVWYILNHNIVLILLILSPTHSFPLNSLFLENLFLNSLFWGIIYIQKTSPVWTIRFHEFWQLMIDQKGRLKTFPLLTPSPTKHIFHCDLTVFIIPYL